MNGRYQGLLAISIHGNYGYRAARNPIAFFNKGTNFESLAIRSFISDKLNSDIFFTLLNVLVLEFGLVQTPYI